MRVFVVDTGIGIPISKQKVIFQEFERLEAGARIERGLGLGLSIVERIVKVLDLKLELVSAPGRGSRFGLTLPRAVPAAVSTPDSTDVVPLALQTPLRDYRVLVIDNEVTILSGMRLILEGWGCIVETATDPAAAVKAMKARKFRPEVMLVDYHLDEGNGIDAIRALRSRFRATIPALLITADRSPEVRDRASGEDVRILNKPVKPSALRALLAQMRQQDSKAAE